MNQNNAILYFPNGQFEVTISEFSTVEGIEINCDEVYYKKIKFVPKEISFDCKLVNCNIKALKKLFKIKYPRKIKKKIFGTRRQRNKIFK
jgi:hypothetical protein